MFCSCRVFCCHSPYHKTRMIFLTFDKIAYNHKSNVPPHPVVFPVMTAATVRKEDGAPQPPQERPKHSPAQVAKKVTLYFCSYVLNT